MFSYYWSSHLIVSHIPRPLGIAPVTQKWHGSGELPITCLRLSWPWAASVALQTVRPQGQIWGMVLCCHMLQVQGASNQEKPFLCNRRVKSLFMKSGMDRKLPTPTPRKHMSGRRKSMIPCMATSVNLRIKFLVIMVWIPWCFHPVLFNFKPSL